jgi:hypothetical protein
MENKFIIGCCILLIFFTIGNAVLYADFRDKIVNKLKEREEFKKELKINLEDESKELEETSSNTYSDILMILKLEPKFKISKFDKLESSSDKIFITIESNESNENRNNIREDLDGIIKMKNFISLKNISIKGDNITVNAEFKMNYK